MDDEFGGSGFVGAATGTEGLRVSHTFYAGDLTLTASDPVIAEIQDAARKGLTSMCRNPT